MHYYLMVEDMEPNHYIAWVRDLPGCFSSASTLPEATAGASARIHAYSEWLIRHDPTLPPLPSVSAIEIVEQFVAVPASSDPDYLVNACFTDDHRPLTYWDVAVALRLLTWSRQDLLTLLGRIPDNRLSRAGKDSVDTHISDIVHHVAVAENWYFDIFGLGMDRAKWPDDPEEQIGLVRSHTRRCLPLLIGDTRRIENIEEHWTARKLVRRMLWHECDHTDQIAQLIG